MSPRRPPGVAELAGRRVRLAPTTIEDAPALFAALDAPEVWRHLTAARPGGVDAMWALVEAALGGGRVPWTVRWAADDAVVGWSSYLDVSLVDERLEVGSTAYAPAVWGGPVNPETKLLLLGHAFDGLGFGRVTLKTDVRNERSQRAIERLGAVREGVLRRYQKRPDGSVRDTVVYSLLAAEWPAARARLERRLAAYR